MALFVVATPIGHPKDITQRAVELIQSCDLVIGEEPSQLDRLINKLKIEKNERESLNEHSTPKEIEALATQCLEKKVVLVSDCGTPGFCDPGAELINQVLKKGGEVKPVPGASSLMALLSCSPIHLKTFHFEGFIPQESEARKQRLEQLRSQKSPIVLMDTPYRFQKVLEELREYFPQRQVLLGLNLTTQEERFYFGSLNKLPQDLPKKAEFLALVY